MGMRASGNGGCWQPRRERRGTTISGCTSRGALWDVGALPELHAEPPHTQRVYGAHQDAMSESESEDEGDHSIVLPTVTMSRTLFLALAAREEVAAAAAAAEASADGGNGCADDVDAGAGDEAGSVDSIAYPSSTKVAFARDERMLELERAKREAAAVTARALAVRLEAAADKVQSVANFFVLEGHGSTLPCHQVQLRSERSCVPQRQTKQPPVEDKAGEAEGGATTSS